jgi:hypothetical protein
LPDRAPSLEESGDLRPSLCVAACCRLPLFVATKGQEKGNIQQEAVNTNGADRVLAKDKSAMRRIVSRT